MEARGKIVGAEHFAGPAQRERGKRVSAWRAPDAEVHAARVQRLEDAKRFRDFQRRVIRQHHAAGTDANPLRDAGYVADHDFRGGAGDQRRVVMLGKPVAREAQLVSELRQVERVAQRVRTRRAGRHRRNIQHRQAIRFPRSHRFPSPPRFTRKQLLHIGEAGTTAAA